jgi:hypothetical protein
MNGFSVHETFDQDPEIYRFEFSDLSQDIHVLLFPLKGGFSSHPGASLKPSAHGDDNDFVPAPRQSPPVPPLSASKSCPNRSDLERSITPVQRPDGKENSIFQLLREFHEGATNEWPAMRK